MRNSTMLNEISLIQPEIINRERETFEVKISKWIRTSGNFVEFQIFIRYLEGDR